MSFSNPIQIINRPVFNESSGLISRRERDHPDRQWRKHHENTNQLDSMVRTIRLLQYQLDTLKKRGGAEPEQIRVQLCVDGVPTYYLLYGEVDPDQTP